MHSVCSSCIWFILMISVLRIWTWWLDWCGQTASVKVFISTSINACTIVPRLLVPFCRSGIRSQKLTPVAGEQKDGFWVGVFSARLDKRQDFGGRSQHRPTARENAHRWDSHVAVSQRFLEDLFQLGDVVCCNFSQDAQRGLPIYSLGPFPKLGTWICHAMLLYAGCQASSICQVHSSVGSPQPQALRCNWTCLKEVVIEHVCQSHSITYIDLYSIIYSFSSMWRVWDVAHPA